MQHRIVRRVAGSLAAVFGVAALLFAWNVSRDPSAERRHARPGPDPAADFTARCARCHSLAGLRNELASRRGEATASARLGAFLAEHHAAPGDDVAAMAELLLRDED
jgi:mono/diheme cytochrome c family protein